MNKDGIDENYEAMIADVGMPTMTSRLRQALRAKLEYGHTPSMSKMMMDIILLACKDAGLKFVYDIQAPAFGKQWAKFTEIELI